MRGVCMCVHISVLYIYHIIAIDIVYYARYTIFSYILSTHMIHLVTFDIILQGMRQRIFERVQPE